MSKRHCIFLRRYIDWGPKIAPKLLTSKIGNKDLTGYKISGRVSTASTVAPSNGSSCKCGVKESSKIVGGQEAIVSFSRKKFIHHYDFHIVSFFFKNISPLHFKFPNCKFFSSKNCFTLTVKIFSLENGRGLLFTVVTQPMDLEW